MDAVDSLLGLVKDPSVGGEDDADIFVALCPLELRHEVFFKHVFFVDESDDLVLRQFLLCLRFFFCLGRQVRVGGRDHCVVVLLLFLLLVCVKDLAEVVIVHLNLVQILVLVNHLLLPLVLSLIEKLRIELDQRSRVFFRRLVVVLAEPLVVKKHVLVDF